MTNLSTARGRCCHQFSVTLELQWSSAAQPPHPTQIINIHTAAPGKKKRNVDIFADLLKEKKYNITDVSIQNLWEWCVFFTPTYRDPLLFLLADPLQLCQVIVNLQPSLEVQTSLEKVLVCDFSFPSIAPSRPVHAADKHPLSTTLTPPCFTVGTVLDIPLRTEAKKVQSWSHSTR